VIAAACVALVAAGAIAFVLTRDAEPEAEQANGLSDVDEATPEPTPPATTSPVPPTAPATVPSTIGPLDVTPGTFSFAEANAASTEIAQRFQMITTTGDVESVVDGVIDSQQRMRMTSRSGDGLTFEIVLDIPGGVAYYSGAGFEDMITSDAEWAAMDLELVLAESGQSLDGLRETMTGRTDLSGIIDGFDPRPLGLTDIEGEPVMLYRISLDNDQLRSAIAANPQFTTGVLAADMTPAVDNVDIEYYVTESNVVRRMVSTVHIRGDAMETSWTYLPVEAGYMVEIPDPSIVEFLEDPAL